MISAVDMTIGEHLSPQVLDRPARIGQHPVERGKGRWRSFDFALVGSSSEPAAAFTNASISPSSSGAMVTGSTIIARQHTDRATVLVIKWL